VTVIIGENDEPVVTNVILSGGAAPTILTNITSVRKAIAMTFRR
jgi:hypothetical protein